MPSTATLPLLLKQLKLPCMFNQWENMALQAQEEHWTYPDYLTALANQECAHRKQKRIQRHTYEAKLPPGKTLDTFDFTSAKSVNAAQITALADNTGWVKQANNVVLFGPSGVGKTHLAAAIGYRLVEQGLRVLFIQTTALVQKLQQARQAYKLADILSKLARFSVLILDDIGYVKKDEAETSVLFELIAERYESNSLIITSNQPFGEWDQIFPNNVMAVAAIDRLVHHATIISISDESYRKHQAVKQAGLQRKGKMILNTS
jgi:DNA replication protein DnaC